MDFLLDWKSMGSLFATIMFFRTIVRDFIPTEVIQALKRFFSYFFTYLQPKMVTILIEEFDITYNNELFDSVQCYLSSKCFSSAQVLKLSKPKDSKNLTFTMDTDQTFEDSFHGSKLNWSFHIVEKKTSNLGYSNSNENRYFQLTFHTRYREMVHSSYFPHIMKEAEIITFKNRERKLYSNRSLGENGRLWSSVPFTHPSTFDTVAMDPFLKNEIKDDLMKFVNRRDFYTRVGRAWKRGYLLYGPPGTGKTSLIASIANFLEFDIYDLELTAVSSNSQLRKLLISTTSKSVIVVEDIDCSLDLSNRNKKKEMNPDDVEKMNINKFMNPGHSSFASTVSLSGVLNFVDGLWSSCGGERLIIFTTNHKEKLDAALLRSGRMDKHINLSFCDIESFKILARNYLEIEEHEIMKEVEEMLGLVKMTPADVAEVFMSCEEDADMGMKNVVEEMKKRLGSMTEEKEEMKKHVEEDLIIEENFEKEEEKMDRAS
ncbi:AAA+ ATPase domain [Macleaya cordata]|uniref:AAA+ ATPase domain n=1 Tax=Macleaya cordata TaxID=56857 RepID=A0A200QRB7_MACCD|nr:AAA+ ATPase domain [Macleaya cordata]